MIHDIALLIVSTLVDEQPRDALKPSADVEHEARVLESQTCEREQHVHHVTQWLQNINGLAKGPTCQLKERTRCQLQERKRRPN